MWDRGVLGLVSKVRTTFAFRTRYVRDARRFYGMNFQMHAIHWSESTIEDRDKGRENGVNLYGSNDIHTIKWGGFNPSAQYFIL